MVNRLEVDPPDRLSRRDAHASRRKLVPPLRKPGERRTSGTSPQTVADRRYDRSYTRGMKTAVSVPNDVFAEAEQVALKAGISRSELYVNALRAYLTASRGERITQQLNDAYESTTQEPDEFLLRAAEVVGRHSKSP